MADLNTLRTNRHTWGQFALSLFVVSWLSVSLQPCLMAMESGADAPMAMASGHSTHAADKASPDVDADCGHCPPAACEVAMSCDVEMSSECQPDVQCPLDSRRVRLILKDLQYDLQPDVAATIVTTTFAGQKTVPPGIRVATYVPGYQPPLNLLNCIYLI